jgi:dynein light intermediate chain 1
MIERRLQGNGPHELKVHQFTREERREHYASILASFSCPLSLPRLLKAKKTHLRKYPPSRFRKDPGLLQGTFIQLDPGTLTHNTASVPIIIAFTKVDLMDDNTHLVGACALRLVDW